MKRFKKGRSIMTEEKFLWAYEEFRKTVYSVIYSYVRNTDDASELSQDTFIKLYTYDGDFFSEEHMKAWLIRVAINNCNNHFRNQKHISASPIPDDLPSDEEPEFDEIICEVMKLPEKYRIPIHLFYYEEYSISEIANILELPEATVKTRLKRGRDKLKKTLRKEDWL
jgi:RNA polymerase sigma-70 factor (ECF subfamily)